MGPSGGTNEINDDPEKDEFDIKLHEDSFEGEQIEDDERAVIKRLQ